jgi:ribosomal protein S18 acetylase RimI-like enzyme
MQIRPYQPADLPVLKQITVEAFTGVSIDHGIEQQFGAINGHDWRWRKARHLDDDAARDPAGVFVAEDTGRIVAYITTWQDREGGIGHIPNIAIRPDYRGQGLGRLLIEHALAHFRTSGLTHAKIETLVQNAVGNHLYTDLGFLEVARQVHFVASLSPGAHAGQSVPRERGG